jgi:hypothetical protein
LFRETDVTSRALTLLLAAAIALALPAAALADPAPAPSSCARTQSIYDWTPVDQSTIIVRTSPNRGYKVTFAAPCYHMKWSVLARVDTRPAGSTICLSRGDTVLFGRGPRRAGNSFEQEERCIVSAVEAIEPADETAPAN